MTPSNIALYSSALASQQNQSQNTITKPFFYEIEDGVWINVGACNRIYISTGFSSYYIYLVIGSNSYYIHKDFKSKDEAKQFLQEEIMSKLK